jgi:hypothetical protein
MERNLTILLSDFINKINDAVSNIAETASNIETALKRTEGFAK